MRNALVLPSGVCQPFQSMENRFPYFHEMVCVTATATFFGSYWQNCLYIHIRYLRWKIIFPRCIHRINVCVCNLNSVSLNLTNIFQPFQRFSVRTKTLNIHHRKKQLLVSQLTDYSKWEKFCILFCLSFQSIYWCCIEPFGAILCSLLILSLACS